MKKILILFAACTLGLTSCELDLLPADQQVQDTALETLDDLYQFRNGTYAAFRAIFSDDLIIGAEFQADYVNAVNGFGNTYGSIHDWTYTTNDYDVYDIWQASYYAIANANFVISKKDAISYDKENAEEVVLFNTMLGEMYFIRAMAHYVLIDKYCGAYDEATASNEYTGIPLCLAYDPTAMPGRSTLAQSYKAVNDDIATAKELLAGAAGVASNNEISIDAVVALEARVALQMKDYNTAYKAATSLCKSQTYSLAATVDELKAIFTYDEGSEIILVPYASVTELAAVSSSLLVYDEKSNNDYYKPQYIPTQSQLDLYSEKDIRKAVYFLEVSDQKCEINGTKLATPVYLMNKYPGNPNLQRVAGTKNYANAVKIFRIAEMYLIAAEAGLKATGGDAKTYLNALRTKRGLAALDTVTLADVKEERRREMMFEGNRISDLKRWGDTIGARTPQTGKNAAGEDYILHHAGDYYQGLTVAATDFRFVWPIPWNEIFANQNLAPQQNPGWQN